MSIEAIDAELGDSEVFGGWENEGSGITMDELIGEEGDPSKIPYDNAPSSGTTSEDLSSPQVSETPPRPFWTRPRVVLYKSLNIAYDLLSENGERDPIEIGDIIQSKVPGSPFTAAHVEDLIARTRSACTVPKWFHLGLREIHENYKGLGLADAIERMRTEGEIANHALTTSIWIQFVIKPMMRKEPVGLVSLGDAFTFYSKENIEKIFTHKSHILVSQAVDIIAKLMPAMSEQSMTRPMSAPITSGSSCTTSARRKRKAPSE